MATQLLLRALTTQELANDMSLLPLIDMINEIYTENLEGVQDIIDRYSGPNEFLKDLGTDGLCAFLLDPSKDNRPVAMAAVKRWKGYRGSGSPHNGGMDWEVGPVASHRDTQYRKKGLVDRCLEALYSRLLAQAQTGTVRLHMTVLEVPNAPYWRRKGYQQDGERWEIPPGEWHKVDGYTVVDMLKEISVSSSTSSGP